jgi:hypothetical protein
MYLIVAANSPAPTASRTATVDMRAARIPYRAAAWARKAKRKRAVNPRHKAAAVRSNWRPGRVLSEE